jgi:hypothetical protein
MTAAHLQIHDLRDQPTGAFLTVLLGDYFTKTFTRFL